MNDRLDPLEEMLREFPPRSVSAAKREQVAERIVTMRVHRLLSTSLRVMAVGLAASLLVAFFMRSRPPKLKNQNDDHVALPQQYDRVEMADRTGHSDPSTPSLWAYRRAADGSLEELDALLVRHGQEILTSEQRSVVSLQRRIP